MLTFSPLSFMHYYLCIDFQIKKKPILSVISANVYIDFDSDTIYMYDTDSSIADNFFLIAKAARELYQAKHNKTNAILNNIDANAFALAMCAAFIGQPKYRCITPGTEEVVYKQAKKEIKLIKKALKKYL